MATNNNPNNKTNSGANAIPTKVITGKGRLSYAYVWEAHIPDEGEGDEARYSTSFLFPKTDTETIEKIKAAIKEAVAQGIKKCWDGKKPANLKLPIRDGDNEVGEKGEAYAGNFFFNASSKRAPDIVDQRRNTIINQDELYSGCYARLSVNFYPFSKKGNKGIAVGLNNIQKWSDGEPLGAVQSKAVDDFDLLEEEDAPCKNTGTDVGVFDDSGDLPFGEDSDTGDLPFGETDVFAA